MVYGTGPNKLRVDALHNEQLENAERDLKRAKSFKAWKSHKTLWQVYTGTYILKYAALSPLC